jgi:hypothetical protein
MKSIMVSSCPRRQKTRFLKAREGRMEGFPGKPEYKNRRAF